MGLKLDELPAELIIHIASNTTPETILALCQVCWCLRSTCYDSLVFMEAFEDVTWANYYFGKHLSDVDLIARYAVAESRHLQLLGQEESEDGVQNVQVKPTTTELLRTLPSLAVTGNDASCIDEEFLGGRRFLDRTRAPTQAEKDSGRLEEERRLASFMYACGLLRCASSIGTDLGADTVEARSDIGETMNYSYDALALGVRNQTEGYVKDFHANCLLGVGKTAMVLAWLVGGESARSPFNAFANTRLGVVRGPHIDNITLAESIAEIPRPFLPEVQSLLAWNRWIDHARQSASNPSYIDGCEWVGMYTYNEPWSRLRSMRFDPPMTGIQFRSRMLSYSGDFLSEGSGVDGIGEFDLRLSMGRDGYVRGRKAYRQQATAWSWYLSNTPFGLYGLWTNETAVGDVGALGGVVWLWKKEWIA